MSLPPKIFNIKNPLGEHNINGITKNQKYKDMSISKRIYELYQKVEFTKQFLTEFHVKKYHVPFLSNLTSWLSKADFRILERIKTEVFRAARNVRRENYIEATRIYEEQNNELSKFLDELQSLLKNLYKKNMDFNNSENFIQLKSTNLKQKLNAYARLKTQDDLRRAERRARINYKLGKRMENLDEATRRF